MDTGFPSFNGTKGANIKTVAVAVVARFLFIELIFSPSLLPVKLIINRDDYQGGYDVNARFQPRSV